MAIPRFYLTREPGTFRGSPIWGVWWFGEKFGTVHRTGKGERYWLNSEEDQVYYPTRLDAAIGLIVSRCES